MAASQRWRYDIETVQKSLLNRLLKRAASTEWGRLHDFSSISSYISFSERVPVSPYPSVKPLIMRMIAGEKDILWPGVTRWYAQSSGTSDGRSKFIPITDDSLRINHYAGGAEVVAHYLASNPASRLFSGKTLYSEAALPRPSTPCHRGVHVGDLSATLIRRINPLANLVRVPDRKIALMPDWNLKLPALVEASLRADITGISGVPSWFLTVLKKVVERAGATYIHDVWPNLEVFFHGGISFGPYREQYRRAHSSRPYHALCQQLQCFGRLFAVQDNPDIDAMLLLADHGIFYEFRPAGPHSPADARPVPAWEVAEGEIYELIITATNGLWRYPVGDTVKIESVSPCAYP